GKKMKLFHRILQEDGSLAATIETLMLHTDLTTRRACLPEPQVQAALETLAAAHAGRPAPGAGGSVGQR
ncbi:carnitine 3-dehydrogenase, partial [Salipiger sp. HF18]|uniref:thioesterase family protein n=1 Tax=Salipiger sp. HF18 TaxID=2721557 RepID=UPI0016950324|nr:carnitine 3-dehydrogenase [Salipiger sp. HF18]